MPSWIVSFPDRLDAFLASDGRMLSRAKAQKAIEEGHVTINDQVVKKSASHVQEGDQVTVAESPEEIPAVSTIEPVDLHLTILYEDDACLVINKPAGVAVHPGAGMAPGELTLLSGIAFVFQKKKMPFRSDSVLVHRLDKETTGCLLIAKTPATHLQLQKQFETRTVKKTYLAIVVGIPEHPTATVDAPIGRSTSNRTKMAIERASLTREAQTTYRVLGSAKNASLLECDLHTGRTHQIRVHLSSIGHPVLGDSTYTSSLSERLNQEHDIRNLCLHAWKLRFVSPADGKEHAIEAPLPAALIQVIGAIGIVWNG